MTIHDATLVSRTTEDVAKKDGSGTYKAIIVKYKSGTEEKKKTLVLNYVKKQNPTLVDKLAKLKEGDRFLAHLTGQFQNLEGVYLPGEQLPEGETVTTPKPKSEFFARGGSGSRPEDPVKQASIIRQSCLKVAAEVLDKLGGPKTLESLKNITLELEAFVKSANTTQAVAPAPAVKKPAPVVVEDLGDEDPF